MKLFKQKEQLISASVLWMLALLYAPFSQAELDCNHVSVINQTECQVLQDLGAGFGVEGEPICNDPRLTCKFAHIESIVLESEYTIGQIPESIGNLSHLRRLHINKSGLTGVIPETIGNLKELEDLELSDNQLTGDIPSSLGNLKKLYKLLLNNNQLTGLIPQSVKELPYLEFLDVSNNLLDEKSFLLTENSPPVPLWGDALVLSPWPIASTKKALSLNFNNAFYCYRNSFDEVDINYAKKVISITLKVVGQDTFGVPCWPTDGNIDLGLLTSPGDYRIDLYIKYYPSFESRLIAYLLVNVANPNLGELTTSMQETPSMGSKESGIGIIRGWACDARKVEIAIDGGSRIPVAYGTSREDTRAICGDADNGYGMVFAWGLLGKGSHRLQTFIDDVEIADVDFEVVGLDQAFAKDLPTRSYRLYDFPISGDSVNIGWSEAHQGFRIHYRSP